MPVYNTFEYNNGIYGDSVSPQPEPLAQRVPWLFQEVDNADEVYEFAINPDASTAPNLIKTYTTQNTTAGGHVIFQGREQVPTMNFGGTILYKEHHDAMYEWARKQKQVRVINDIGDRFGLYITSFSPTRRHSMEFRWWHEYQVEGILLGWP